MKWQHNETDLENFISYLRTEVKEKEQIVRFKIENKRAVDMGIAMEPQGSGDTFPTGAIYEVVIISKQETPDIHIEIHDNDVVVYCRDVTGAIFDKGVATLAY